VVRLAIGPIRRTNSSPAAMLTPALAYVILCREIIDNSFGSGLRSPQR
jgi:hypothetical protein